MTDIANQIKDLKDQRKQARSRLTRFITFFHNPENQEKFNELASRLETIKGVLSEFENIQTQLEHLSPTEVNEQEIVEFENTFFKITSEVQAHLNRTQRRVFSSTRSSNDSVDSIHQVKLPSINLPCFTGQFTEWVTFRDTFNSLINENDNLTNIQKFHYLKSSLQSVPLQTIEHLTPSDNNYTSAWELLKSRYENVRLITQHHIRAIFSLPNINKEAQSLRKLLHGLTSHVKSLEAIKRPVQHWDDILVHLISTKFDYHTTIAWENTLTNNPPTVKELTNFLQQRCQMLESIEINTTQNKSNDKLTNPKLTNYNKFPRNHITSHVTTNQYITKCVICNQQHKIYYCKKFLSLSINERLNQIKKYNLCQNCLHNGHTAEKCNSGGCKSCTIKHNSLLHPVNTVDQENVEISSVNAFCDNSITNHVILSTALVNIVDINNKIHTCRALLDSGSQSNFITSSLCNKLGLRLKAINISVTGINQSVNKIINKSNITIQSRLNSCSFNLDCLVLEKITSNLPITKFSINKLNIPSNITLADPSFNISGQIDILLGAEIFWELLCDPKMQTNIKHLYLQQTQLGFIIGGKINSFLGKNNPVCNLSVDNLDKQMTKFWEIDGFYNSKVLTTDEQAWEAHFTTHVMRDPNGRFMVQLPFRKNPPDLGLSKKTAMKRFLSLENKFKKDRNLENDYKSFINEYKLLDHLEPVPFIELQNMSNLNSYYLAHHAVFKDSTTTKLRVVFDGSCPSSNGKSLNDNLLVGPALQQNLFYILTRFRMHQYVIFGDIAKMYRQILIHSNDQKHQLILLKNHHTTHLIINYYHIQQLHAGCQAIISALRQKYWIIACRSSVRYILFKCIKCFKLKPTSFTQLMGDLPETRITPSRPFTYTAIDYAGPIIIKNGHGRTTKTLKGYIAVFVCFATKAVHLELVCDCTSSTFLNSLKRFMARRGKVSMLYSDNGTNFVGANGELSNLFKSQQFQTDVINSLTQDQIKWKFIPPRSPHMNGLADAAVKSTKRHLKLILGNSRLNYEEMYTVLTMIEACLNSRPISSLSNDPEDLCALTPGHFLIGDALTAPAEPDLIQTADNRLSRYQLLEKLRQHFWSRWSAEYLQQLQIRVKWNKVTQQPTPGTLVLLQEDNTPPQHWILGRIQTCHPGADGLTRIVSVKTVRGVVKRAISKLCPLPAV